MKELSLLVAAIIVVVFETSAQQVNEGLMAYDAVYLYQHLKNNVKYPDEARQKGIQGVVYVEFKVDSLGTLAKQSIRIPFGLTPSCDKEVVRVVALYPHKFSKDKKTGWRTFIVPVNFALTDGLYGFPSHILSLPVKTVVIPKKVNANVPSWSVYELKGFNNAIGKISPGDTIVVTGWAANCYFIQTKNISGFISRKAVMINAQLEAVDKEMDAKLVEEEILEEQQYKLWVNEIPSDTIKNYSSETAHLSLTSNRNSIFLGECATITLAFNVRVDNKSNLYFIEAGTQMMKITNDELDLPGAFVVNNNIEDIQVQKNIINGKDYVTYKIFQGGYCPNKSQSIQIPSIKFYMRVDESVDKQSVKKMAEFKTKPVVVAVKPLPAGAISTYGLYKMVGNFTIEEDTNNIIVNKGDAFTFQVKVKGKGLLFPLEPPRIQDLFLKPEFIEVHDNDTIINDELYSDKTFIYRATSEMEGTYDLGKAFNFSFFNPENNRTETIRSSIKIVSNNNVKTAASNKKHSFYRDNFIVMDVSQSMLMEDYLPNRLEAVKEGVLDFLKHQRNCNIGLITFGGNAYVWDNDINQCYSDLNFDVLQITRKSGTAIGDAIWLALVSMGKESTSKKIIIIGDGDKTAGTLSPLYAAELAKSKNVRIYTVGVGSLGMVPYGKDSRGNVNYIYSTFSDVDFRKISELTGGKYYHAESSKSLTEIMNRIFSE